MFSTRGLRSVFVWILAAGLSGVAQLNAAEKGGVTIRQVQVGENGRVDLLLDGKIQESQIRTEFINDIIQLSLTDASVYPAKISSVSGQELTKIFVYQYAPKLVRVRLTVKGKAEAYQGKIAANPNGKLLSISLNGATRSAAGTDRVVSQAAQMRKKPEAATAATTDAEERALLDRILSADKPTDAPKAAVAAAEPAKPAPAKSVNAKAAKVSRPEDLINPGKALLSFVGVLLLLGACVFALRKLAAQAGKGKNGALSKLLTKTLGKPEKMIDVVATHYLGPKKSIHVVRVAGRTLVLGVSDGSINLISEFNGEAAPSAPSQAAAVIAAPAPAAGGDFLAALGEEIARESGASSMSHPVMNAGTGAVAAGPAIPATSRNARDRIRARLEGMKQL